MEDAIRNTTRAHREGVIWFLDWRLGEVARLQRDMMETRLEREIERSKSALYKTRGSAGVGVVAAASDEMGLGLGLDASSANGSAARANATTSFAQRQGKVTANKIAMAEDDAQRQKILDGLSTEQLQMFEQENSDMLRQYEETLDQVRYVAVLPLLLPRCLLPTSHPFPAHPLIIAFFEEAPLLHTDPLTKPLSPPLLQDRRAIHPRNRRAAQHPDAEPRRAVRAHQPARGGCAARG